MIVSSMSLTEVAAALRKDVVHLQQHVADKYWELERRHRKGGKGVMVQCGEHTTADRIQWVYVVTISTTKTTLYPMAWYFTRQGIHAFQIDAEGPATYLRPHVLERYRQRYYPDADVLQALRQMHARNYDKASEPREYQGRPTIASAVEDGYFLGDHLYSGTVVDYHTFYDVPMGAKLPALREMRKLLEWRRYFAATNPKAKPNGYVNWGQGFPLRLERLVRAA
jgi:hypothetical protein